MSARGVYRALWRVPAARRMVLVSAIARVPTPMLSLTLLLAADRGYPFGVAGAVSGCFALGQGLGAPVRARVADRAGAKRVLTICFVLMSVVIAALLLAIDRNAAPALVCVLAAAGGLAFPPLGVTLRVLWTRLLDDPHLRHAGLTLDTAVMDVALVAGAPLATLSIAVVGVDATAIAIVAALGAAVVALPEARDGEAAEALADRPRPWPLRLGRMRRLTATSFMAGAALGATQIALVAVALDGSGELLAGCTLGAFAAGSLCGSLVFGRYAHGVRSDRWLARFVVAQGLTLLPALLLTPWPWLLLLAAPLAGLAIGPTYTLLSSAAGVATPLGSEIEAQAWINSADATGAAIGMAVAGGLAPVVALVLAVCVALLSGTAVWPGRAPVRV